MHVIKARNVHAALPEAARLIKLRGVPRKSRNGAVLVLDAPLTTHYTHPVERVLFWPARDANPFFHLFESLWMLAGRNDVKFPAKYNKQISKYSDNGLTFNGAYGFRWRVYFSGDQLRTIAGALTRDPDCRRQVLTMWDPRRDLGASSKDVPCNTHIYFQRDAIDGALHMMVCNRSNDAIWGAYGANAVHFSVLLEWMAARIGCPVGYYHQVSMNTHVYTDVHGDLLEQLAAEATDPAFALLPGNPYSSGVVGTHPLVSTPIDVWERDLHLFLSSGSAHEFDDPFFNNVVRPMARAHGRYTADTPGRYDEARAELRLVGAADWRLAAIEWIDRREQRARA